MTIRLHDLNTYTTIRVKGEATPIKDIPLGSYVNDPGSPLHGFRVSEIQESRVILRHDKHPHFLVPSLMKDELHISPFKPDDAPVTPHDLSSEEHPSITEIFYRQIGKHFYEPITLSVSKYYTDGTELFLLADDQSIAPLLGLLINGKADSKYISLNRFREWDELPREIQAQLRTHYDSSRPL